MVSTTVLVVVVFEVIEPCVKFGTTGTALAAPAPLSSSNTVSNLFMTSQGFFRSRIDL